MRKLLGTLVLTVGLLSLALSVRADPVECTDICKESSVAYRCGEAAAVYEQTSCLWCQGDVPGWKRCQTPATGGKCVEAMDQKGNKIQVSYTVYGSGFEACPDACKDKATGTFVEGFPSGKKTKTFTTYRVICVKADPG